MPDATPQDATPGPQPDDAYSSAPPQHTADRLARLQEVTAALSEALTPAEVAGVIADQGMAALGAFFGGVTVLADGGAELITLGSAGVPPEVAEMWRHIPLDTDLPLTDAVRTGKPVWLESPAERAARYPDLAARNPRIGATIALPLIAEGRVFGAFNYNFRHARHFREDERAFLLALARQCALALHRARLYEAAEKARLEAEVARRRTEEILESIDDAFYAVDTEWRFTYVNRRAEVIWGIPRETLLGKHLWSQFPRSVGTPLHAAMLRAAREGKAAALEFPSEAVGRWLEVHVYPADGGLSVYFRDISERKRMEEENARLMEEAREAAVRQRMFLRDVLAGVTEGCLRLCDDAGDLPARHPPVGEAIPLAPATLRDLRRVVREAARAEGLEDERIHDLETAAGEAAMNAVVHAGGGWARVHRDEDGGMIQVWVEDTGSGIDMSSLPRATMERGYTTAGSFGHGFWLMVKLADRIHLLTGPEGTTVVIEQDREPPDLVWLTKG